MPAKERQLTLSDGRTVKVKSLKLGGLYLIADAFEQSREQLLGPIIEAVTLFSRNTALATAPLDNPRELLTVIVGLLQDDQARAQLDGLQASVIRAVLATRLLLQAVVAALSDLDEDDVLELEPADALQVLSEAIDFVDVAKLVEAAELFFARLGARMAASPEAAVKA